MIENRDAVGSGTSAEDGEAQHPNDVPKAPGFVLTCHVRRNGNVGVEHGAREEHGELDPGFAGGLGDFNLHAVGDGLSAGVTVDDGAERLAVVVVLIVHGVIRKWGAAVKPRPVCVRRAGGRQRGERHTWRGGQRVKPPSQSGRRGAARPLVVPVETELGQLRGDGRRLAVGEGNPDPLADNLGQLEETRSLGAEQAKQLLGGQHAIGLPLREVDARTLWRRCWCLNRCGSSGISGLLLMNAGPDSEPWR
jgi:hypothetical protein